MWGTRTAFCIPKFKILSREYSSLLNKLPLRTKLFEFELEKNVKKYPIYHPVSVSTATHSIGVA